MTVRMSAKQTSPTSGKNKILFQVGARLEAMDYTLNWYSAKICRVDEKEKKVLIHFEGWNHRYDEWIAIDSVRLRPHTRQQSYQDIRDDKDWKAGDRVLAKWQDCKFYPAKILKSLSDGGYEVLFYDGIKKVVHRVNVKPDTKKMPMTLADKLEHDREIQERRERRQLMATARAERARKRSADVSPTPPMVPVKRKDGRGRKGQAQERDEFGTASESSLSGPSCEVVEVDEVSQDSEKIKPKEGELEAEQSMDTIEPACEDVLGNDSEKVSEEKNITESTFTDTAKQMTPLEQKQKHVSSVKPPSETEESVSSALKKEKEYTTQLHESLETGVPASEQVKEDSSWNVNTQESGDLTIKTEDSSNCGEERTLNIQGNIKSESVQDSCKNIHKKEGRTEDIHDDGDSEVVDVKLKSHNVFPSTELNEPSKDTNICDTNTSTELHQKETESSESAIVAPKLEPDTSMESKPSDSSLHKIKTSKGPKIKRTLSRAERLSRNRKAKTGLTLKMGFKGTSPLKVTLPSKRADTPEVSVPAKGTAPVKATVKSEKTVHRRKSSKGSRSSSISPRGYGYSMAFMDMDKPGSSVARPEPETERGEPLTESRLTDALKISTQSMACSTPSPTSPVISTGTPTESTPAPKKQTYQAKKFRLDQITGKLTAQRQSEAQAAAHSPSAFQLAKHSSPQPPPPPLTPSPPANPPPPYPRESYPPPGPPPLIYSPMPGSCCPTPHHQRMYGPHPGHGMRLPTGHLPPHPDYPPPSSGYMLYAHGMTYPPPPPGPCIGQCSCNAGVRPPVYHPLPPGAPPRPPPTHDSALAQLMQCEQRILHGAPGMPHYREAAPPGPWITHRHGHPPPQSFIPVSRHHEDLWHAHEERALQPPPALQAPPPSSISPTSESGKNGSRRSRKNERPLPTKALPASAVPGVDAPVAPSASETDSENISPAEKGRTHQNEVETAKESTSKPEIVDPSTQDMPKTKPENQSKTAMASSQLPAVSSQEGASVMSTVSFAGGGTPTVVSTVGAASATPSQETTLSLASLLPASKGRKGKDFAPKELVIEIDHNKYKCKLPGCDKSFRKESGLEYHVKYYHEQQPGMKRKKSISVRSDSTPETSPEFGSRRVTKRRIHRSSAPAQLSSSIPVTSPTSLLTPATKSSESMEIEPTEHFRSVSMDSEPSVNQDTDLEIDGGGVEVESIDLGVVESMEVEEEEDVNGDVIRCLCNETEEGGFMIQCEQCLTWQHSECVGLSEQTVPPNYLCYVCTNPRGLRRSAKYKNDFDWFRRGTLACMPFVSIEEPEYSAELNLATHGLMGDLHDVNSCLRSLKLKFELLRNPSHPDLKYWCTPKKSDMTPALNNEDKSSTNTDSVVTNSSSASLNEQGQSIKPVSADNNGHAIINGHTEIKDTPQNGLVRVKQERSSTPPPSLEGPGDSNNNVHNQKAPLSTSTGSMSLSSVPVTSSSEGHGSFIKSGDESDEGRVNTVKKEEEPLSPIPALVPVGGQTSYVKESTPNTKSDSSLPSVKNKSDREDTGQPGEIKSSGVSSEVKPTSLGGSSRADCSEVRVPSSESKPQSASDAQIKQENDSKVTAQGGGVVVSDIKEEVPEESVRSLSDDEGAGAMNNLLGDVTQMQDDLEERMSEIERQLTVLEEAYGGTPSQLTKKTDFRKLVKDLNRVRRILQQIS